MTDFALSAVSLRLYMATGVPDTCEAGGDLNGDGVVGIDDFLILLASWGSCPPAAACPADLDDDGVVGITDFLMLLAAWG